MAQGWQPWSARVEAAIDEYAYSTMYEVEDTHWWFRGRRAVLWGLLQRRGVRGPLHLLDAGCGTGRHLLEYGVLGEAHGVDPSPAAVAACRERGLERVEQAPVEDLPFPTSKFGLILATDVLEHLDDDVAALRELRRVAAPGATLVVTVPALMWLWSDEDVRLQHRRRYRRHDLIALVSSAGWEPRLATYFNTCLLLPIALARKLRPLGFGGGAGSSEMQMSSGWLSMPLFLPLRLEASLIRRGVRLPIGVSIALVATARA